MTHAKRPRIPPKHNDATIFDELVLRKEFGNIRAARIVRVVHDKGYGFLRGDSDNADTFFHIQVVRFTAAELKKRPRGAGADADEPFKALEVGARVLYLPSGMSKDGKGARARWVGVGDPGEI